MINNHKFNDLFSRFIESPSFFAEQIFQVKLYDYEREILEALPRYSRIVILKGRQIGITWTMALGSLWYASIHPNSRVLVLSLNQDQSKRTIEFCKDFFIGNSWLVKEFIYAPIQEGLTSTKIKLLNGSEIEAKGCTRPKADNVRSRRADLLFIDEAILLYDEMMSAVRPISVRGGTLVEVTTAGAEGCIFHRDWAKIRGDQGEIEGREKWIKGDRIAFTLPACQLNDKIHSILCPDVTLKDLEDQLELGELNFRREYCCQWLGATNQIYPQESKWVIPKILLPKGIVVGGLDAGRMVNPHVLTLIKGTKREACVIYVRRWKGRSLPSNVARDVKEIVDKFNVQKILFDQTGPGFSLIEPFKKEGIPFRGFEISDKSKNEVVFSPRNQGCL